MQAYDRASKLELLTIWSQICPAGLVGNALAVFSQTSPLEKVGISKSCAFHDFFCKAAHSGLNCGKSIDVLLILLTRLINVVEVITKQISIRFFSVYPALKRL